MAMEAFKKTVRWVFDYEDEDAAGDKPVIDSSDEDEDEDDEDDSKDAASKKKQPDNKEDEKKPSDHVVTHRSSTDNNDKLPSLLKKEEDTRSARSRRSSSSRSSLRTSIRASLRRSKKRDSATNNNMEDIEIVGEDADTDSEDNVDREEKRNSSGSDASDPPRLASKRASAKRSSNTNAAKRVSWRSSLGRGAAKLGFGGGGGSSSFASHGTALGAISEDGEFKQAKLEDSNIAGIGSKEDRALRKEAAESDKQLRGAGKKVGVQVWRVENKRTKSDTPDFGVKKWPREEYGNFYSGDSYVILNTYFAVNPVTRKPEKGRMDHDVHFWLGKDSSQDEIGVAAIKTVELSALLDDRPVHHRERQGHESKLFLSYFKEVVYMDGGIESGFRKVRPVDYEPRLLMIRHTSKVTKAFSIPCEASSMNHGDCFVLDAGSHVYRWVGEESDVFEKNRSGLLQHNIVSSRNGKAVKADCDDDMFWKVLRGSERDVRPAEDPYAVEVHGNERLNASEIRLWRLSDASGSLQFTLEAEGKVPQRILDSDDVFIVHANVGLWVWIGSRATSHERASGMAAADRYIAQEKLSPTLPVTSLTEAQAMTNPLFASLFRGK